MTQSKKFFVDRICRLRGWSPESEQGRDLYTLKIVDLLIIIKQETPGPEEDSPEFVTDRFFTN